MTTPMLWMMVLTMLHGALTVVLAVPLAHENKVLLISFDGFRWDYLDTADTPNFDKLIEQGSKVKQVSNAYATLTMPNHYTIVTGLFEEDHGIIANKFYDPLYKKTYNFGREAKWYNATEPIWITAEREGVKTGSYMWVGNQAEFNGKAASKVVPFKYNADLKEGLDVVVNWLSKENIQFAAFYTDEPDKTGHKYGPVSNEIREKVSEIDSLIGYLIERLAELELTDKVNILIASDHGMTDVSNKMSIDLSQYVNFTEDVFWSYTSAVGLILPQKGKIDKVYNQLKLAEDNNETHFKVYKKEEVPEELHYRKSHRIPPIVIVPDNGWLLKKGSYKINVKGNHGFNNQESDMKTMLIARGPNFKCGYNQDSLRSVDLYPLMCHLLNLKACHASAGELSSSSGMLSKEANCLSKGGANQALAATSYLISALLLTQMV